MNKLYLLGLATLLPLNAMAATPTDYGFFFKPYLGADYDQYHTNYSSGNDGVFSNNLNGGDIHIGARIHKYAGFEVSYFDTASSSESNVRGTGLSTKAKLDGGSLDIMGYLPLGESQKFELIGTVGITTTKTTGDISNGNTAGNTETKGRIGAGAQYWLTDNLNARALIRYQDADVNSQIDNFVVTTVGLNWQF